MALGALTHDPRSRRICACAVAKSRPAGASSAHSPAGRDFARFGCRFAALHAARWALWLLCGITAWAAQTSALKLDEDIVFYPTMAYRAADGTNWNVEVHGCVYEPDKRMVELAL